METTFKINDMKGKDIKRIYGLRGLVPENTAIEDEKDYILTIDSDSNAIWIYDNNPEQNLIYYSKFKIEKKN